MDKERFGSFIAKLRRERKMTQQELAGQLHVTDRAVSKWERGLSYPDVTLLEPLAAALEIGVETLLTGQTAEAAPRETESAALRSVLAISGEERQQHRRRMTRCAALAAALVLVVALLAAMQHNGRLLVGERSVSPDGSMTMTVYRTSLLGGGFAVESSHPLPWTAYCRHCHHSSARLATQRQLDSRVTGMESLQWSADGQYLLLCGSTSNTYAPSYVKVWDFTADGEDSAVQELDIDVGILVGLAGYDDPAAPKAALLPCLPGISQHTFLPNVTLSGVHWIGSGHQLTADYAYDGTDGQRYTGTLSYDIAAQSVSVLRQSST